MPLPTIPPGRNCFFDPRVGGSPGLYIWDANHNEEQAGARLRVVTSTHPTIARWRNVRAIRQQAGRDELVYKLAGMIPTLAQHEAFLRFQELSQHQSIYFFHAAGEKFECMLSDYEPQRKYVLRSTHGEKYIWIYAIQLDVITTLT